MYPLYNVFLFQVVIKCKIWSLFLIMSILFTYILLDNWYCFQILALMKFIKMNAIMQIYLNLFIFVLELCKELKSVFYERSIFNLKNVIMYFIAADQQSYQYSVTDFTCHIIHYSQYWFFFIARSFSRGSGNVSLLF